MIFLGKELNTYDPFIVAELSCSHGGEIDEMYALMACAKHCGADAVKFQLYSPADMTIDHDSDDFIIKSGPWAGQTYWKLYRTSQTQYAWVPHIFDFASKINLPCFASVFSERGIAALEAVNCPAYKIASFEIVHYPLIRAARATGKPMVMSTGLATNMEVRAALTAAKGGNNILLHCISAYPAPYFNFDRITDLAVNFGNNVGFSDHSLSLTSGYSAKHYGAVMLEKHLTLGKGEDKSFALNADQFAKYVAATRRNGGEMDIDPGYTAVYDKDGWAYPSSYDYRRSIYVIKDIEEGETFTKENIAIIRPRFGMHPTFRDDLLKARKAEIYLSRGQPLKMEHVRWMS
jgi:sialic acid synthase SpsE